MGLYYGENSKGHYNIAIKVSRSFSKKPYSYTAQLKCQYTEIITHLHLQHYNYVPFPNHPPVPVPRRTHYGAVEQYTCARLLITMCVKYSLSLYLTAVLINQSANYIVSNCIAQYQNSSKYIIVHVIIIPYTLMTFN